MGVDYYTCDKCDENVYEGNIVNIKIKDIGEQMICNRCKERYLEIKFDPFDIDYYGFIVSTYIRLSDTDIVYTARPEQIPSMLDCIPDTLGLEEQDIANYEIYYRTIDDDPKKFQKGWETDTNIYWYPKGKYKECFMDIEADFLKHLQKNNKYVDDYAYYQPNHKFKTEMIEDIDDKIERLTVKRRKIKESLL